MMAKAAPKSPRAAAPLPSTAHPYDTRARIALALFTLTVTAVLVFLVPRMVGDVFMTLAGGRDVLDGKLGDPDDWAFTTQGRVWINQAWGTGVLFYLTQNLLGENGLALLKANLIVVSAVFLVLSGRRLGASYTISLLVAAAALMACRHFIDIRANLVGLTSLAVVLWLFYRSQNRPQRIWFVVVWTTIWANMHGSFIFALGMMGLWTLCTCVVLLWSGAPRTEWARHWPLPVATLAATILAAATSPYGVTNLTQPFTLVFGVGGEPWPIPAIEMFSVLSPHNKDFMGLREFFIFLGLLAAALTAGWCFRAATPRSRRDTRDPARVTVFLFLGTLVLLTVGMAFAARRFIPIALIVSTPILALSFQWALSDPHRAWATAAGVPAVVGLGYLVERILAPPAQGLIEPVADLRLVWPPVALALGALPVLILLVVRGRRSKDSPRAPGWPRLRSILAPLSDPKRLTWPLALLAATFLFASAPLAKRMINYHRPDHPRFVNQSMFRRLVRYSSFPDEAATFLSANQIAGNAFNDRRWEGLLRWRCPPIKVFFGGRSRQVYPPEVAVRVLRYQAGQDMGTFSQPDMKLMIVARRDFELVRRIILAPGSPWAAIYSDPVCFIVANRNNPQGRQLIDAAAAGQLQYATEGRARVSQFVCLVADCLRTPGRDIMSAATRATEALPALEIYRLLAMIAAKQRIPDGWLRSFLERELYRLEDIDFQYGGGIHVLYCRLQATRILGKYHEHHQRDAEAEFYRHYGDQIEAAVRAVRNRVTVPPIDRLPPRTGAARDD